MDFKLKDLGKIKKADIKLDGITVICGDRVRLASRFFPFIMLYMIIRQKSVCRKIQGLRILSCRI